MERINFDYLQNDTKQKIYNASMQMTPLEKSIAKYFLKNNEAGDFSSKNISHMLYVSEPSLSRFAKKCGFKGYREFIFSYEKDIETERLSADSEKNISVFSRKVQTSYQNLLMESFKILDEDQIRRIARLLSRSRKTFAYGMGSSGYVAKEFQLRFMRIGLDVEAITDSQMIQMSAALSSEYTLIIAISLSGTTKEVLDSIRIGSRNGAKIVFITSSDNREICDICTEVLKIPSIKDLDLGMKISPQFPILMAIDVLYSYYFGNDSFFKTQKYNDTLLAIRDIDDNGKQN